MKKSCSSGACTTNKTQNIIMTVLRIGLGAAMLFFGLSKLGGLPEVTTMLGGAAHSLGLTFLPVAVWGWMAIIGEIVAGILLVFGCCKSQKIGAILTLIIMLVAAGGAHGWTLAGGAGRAYVFGLVAIALMVFPGRSLLDLFGCGCGTGSCKTTASRTEEIIEA